MLWGCGTSDMKSGRRRPAAHRRDRPRAQPRPHLRLLRQRGGRRRPQRPRARRRGPPRVAGRRLRRPPGALRRPGRGRLPGHAAGAAADRRASAPTPRAAGWAPTPSTRPPRSWPGSPRTSRASPVIDGLEYREGLNAVGIEGGVASNVIPDACTVVVNFRYAPDRTEEEAHGPRPRGLRGLRRRRSSSSTTTPARRPARPRPTRPPRPSWRRSAAPPSPSSAGRTSPASARSACPRSTTAPATRTAGPQARRAGRDGRRSWRPRSGCGPG